MTNIQVAVDGPASSGKSSVSQVIAKRLGLIYIDTGAMYRGVTLAVLKQGISPTDVKGVEGVLESVRLDFKLNQEGVQELYLNDINVSREIRSKEVTEHVSEVSAYAVVRERLVKLQQEMAAHHSVIMDGRDIGTVVLPKADFKFFLEASPRVRAMRRYKENQEKDLSNQSLEEIEAAIIARDHYDSTREHSPLKKANDAVVIDTDPMTVESCADALIAYMESKL